MKQHPMILGNLTPDGILLLDADTLTLACWRDATPDFLFVQAQEPPAPETMEAFHQALVARQYQGQPPVFITSPVPLTGEETIVLLGDDHIATHHPASSLTLLYGGTEDLPPRIRKSGWEARRPQLPEITLDLVAEMNAALGRTFKNGIPVAPFMASPRLIG